MQTQASAAATFTIGESGDVHEVGNVVCPECWQDPTRCEREGCSGLVHYSFGDENYDGDYWLYSSCDVCGEAA